MLISADPQEDNGNPDWPRCYVHIFRSPAFEQEEIPAHKMGSIGIGQCYEKCRGIVDTFSNSYERRFFYMETGTGGAGGIATSIGHDLTILLKSEAPEFISSHLHYCWVYRGQIIIESNDHVSKGPWTISPLGHRQDEFDFRPESHDEGSEIFRMPRVAQTWLELEDILHEQDLSAAGAVA
jgi:hypothetical protein